jgi:putative PIN family toxin of toxin-antitoxin system
MIVVIDTNALLQALGRQSAIRALLEAWFSGSLVWAINTEILLEYEEIITKRSGKSRWQSLAGLLDMVTELRPETLLKVEPSFHFHLITSDPDDNKFADCAIAADADFIITSDHHFDVLIGSGYKPQPITPEEFIRRHLTLP